jgi:hypothetical protein
MKTLVASLAMLAAAAATTPQTPVGYRFDEVKRTVVLKTANQESPAAKGLHAQNGDRVHTGLFSYALIAAEQHRAKFEIFGSTDVQLAGGTPGVILSLERGRIHALFDKITGSEPRIVQTPGALLAVRGTQYSVEVDDSGKATLDVFEGTVEVRSPLHPEPVLVHAGQSSVFSRQQPPPDHPTNTPPDRRQAPSHPDGSDPHATGQQGAPHPGDPGAHGTQPPGPPSAQPRPAPPPPGTGGHH